MVVQIRKLALLLIFVLLATACGASGNTDAEGVAGDPTETPPDVETSPEETDSDEEASEPVEPIDITFVASSPGMATLDLWIARHGGYFEEEGLNIEWGPYLPDGPGAANVVLTDADLSSTAVSGVLTAMAGDRPLKAFAASAHGGATGLVTIHADVAEQLEEELGVTADSPWEDRVDALRGLTLGVSSPVGAVTLLLRQALESRDIDPDRDAELTVVDLQAMPVALREKQIDGFMISPPHSVLPETEGYGVVWLRPADVPVWQEGVYINYVTSDALLEENPEIHRRFIRAVERGAKLLREDPEAATAIVQEQYPDLDEKTLLLGIESTAAAFQGTHVTRQQVQQAIDAYNSIAEDPVDFTPEDIWWEETLD